MFPSSIEGSIEIADASLASSGLLDDIESALRSNGVADLTRSDTAISFERSVFRPRLIPDMSFLSSIDSGEIALSRSASDTRIELRYRLGLRQTLLFITGAVVALGVIAASRGGYGFALAFIAIGWLWMFGMTYFVTRSFSMAFLRDLANPTQSRDFWDG